MSATDQPQPYACLVIADESEEFPVALLYGGILAKSAGWRLIMLRVIEPSDPAPWATITEEIRQQAHAAGESLTQRFAAEIWAECGITAEPVLREGDLKPEIRKYLNEDASIKLLVLASAPPPASPGPLVSSLAKQGLGGRAVPVVVVPGVLSKDEIRALAVSVTGASLTAPAETPT